MSPLDLRGDGRLTDPGISTSAGESTDESSRATGRRGRWTERTRQPWCLRTPWNGGLPSTLPIRRMAAGSKSVGTLTGCLLGRVDDRLDGQVVVQRLAAAAVDVADRGADLGVGVGVDVLLEEVDQPAVPLEDREDAEVRAGRRLEKSGSTRAAKSGSVRIRQKVLRASQNRFKARTSRSIGASIAGEDRATIGDSDRRLRRPCAGAGVRARASFSADNEFNIRPCAIARKPRGAWLVRSRLARATNCNALRYGAIRYVPCQVSVDSRASCRTSGRPAVTWLRARSSAGWMAG